MDTRDVEWATYAALRGILEELAHRSKSHLYTNHIAFSLADICEDFLRDLPLDHAGSKRNRSNLPDPRHHGRIGERGWLRPQAIQPVVDSGRFIRWLIHGDPGVGKTPFICELPKTLILDGEGG